MIDKATVNLIRDTADIVDVVSDYVHLTRRGANYVGLCPFHNERTPSFSVSKAKNFCYCFSCHKGGSPVNFIMEKEGVSYVEALRILAKKYNIPIEERDLTDREKEERSEREAMLVANEWAAADMASNLLSSAEGQDIGLSYLYGRGVTREAVMAFRLGYAIDGGTVLADKAKSKGFDLDVLYKTGLIGRSKQGAFYDRFRGRVIFPILNTSGKPVGFGGRDLKGGPAKYINSPESAVYNKSSELYGIFQAKSEIGRRDKCYLVEGYLDVIGMWQSGIQNVVASSGTALTDGQIALIHRFTDKITLIYDGDAAGIKASLRGIDMLLKHRMEVKVLLLPDGHDPDSFARENTPESFRSYIDNHETDIIRFQTQVLLDAAGNDPQQRIAAANSVVRSIACIPDVLARAVYIQECAKVFGLSEDSIAKAVDNTRRSNEEAYAKEKAAERRRHLIQETENHNLSLSHALPDQPGASLSSDTGSGKVTDSPSHWESPSEESPQKSPASFLKSLPSSQYPLRKLEKELIRVVLQYGLLPFCEVDPDRPEAGVMNVAEFVDDELKADDISFSFPPYARIFQTLLGLKEEFDAALPSFMSRLETQIDAERQAGEEEIRIHATSVAAISSAEKKLDSRLSQIYDSAIREFTKDFPGRILASHHDSDIRNLCTELMLERAPLSAIYFKDLKPQDIRKAEDDTIEQLVPRRILELKDGVVGLHHQSLMDRLRQASKDPATTPGEIQTLQNELMQVIRIRSQLSRDLGERIVNPHLG